jgi:hypothetical protein
VNTDHVRRDDLIVGGLALLLLLDLLILAWFSFGGTVTVGSTSISFGGSLTATDAPDGWLGVLAVISSLLILVDLAIEALSPQTAIPAIGGSRTNTRFVLALATALFMGLKFLFHLGHFSNLGIGFWIGAALVIALVYFALQARNTGTVSAPSTAGPAAPTGSSGPPPGSSGPPTG